MAPPSRRLVFGVVATRLSTVTKATGYYAQIGRPLLEGGAVTDPAPKSDQDPRVQPYFILFPGAGGDGEDTAIADDNTGLGIDWRVTAAGGDVDDVLALFDRVEALLVGWTPVLAGVSFSPVRRQPGYRPIVQTDTTKRPERLFIPGQYVLFATT